MFNDKYGLTKAVLEGRKTMTRRIMVPQPSWVNGDGHIYNDSKPPRFKVGEVVAVAQSLRDMGYDPRDTKHKSGAIWGLDHTPAWTNKMFVSASECIHHILITNVRVERLQDISDEDCLREGIYNWKDAPDCPPGHKDSKIECYGYDGSWDGHLTPITAFAALIDKISGKGTWASNPWVFVYEFELVKQTTMQPVEKTTIADALDKHHKTLGEIVRTAFTKHFGYPLTNVKDPENLAQLSELGGNAITLLYRGEAYLKIEREEFEVDYFLEKPEWPQFKATTRYIEV